MDSVIYEGKVYYKLRETDRIQLGDIYYIPSILDYYTVHDSIGHIVKDSPIYTRLHTPIYRKRNITPKGNKLC